MNLNFNSILLYHKPYIHVNTSVKTLLELIGPQCCVKEAGAREYNCEHINLKYISEASVSSLSDLLEPQQVAGVSGWAAHNKL